MAVPARSPEPIRDSSDININVLLMRDATPDAAAELEKLNPHLSGQLIDAIREDQRYFETVLTRINPDNGNLVLDVVYANLQLALTEREAPIQEAAKYGISPKDAIREYDKLAPYLKPNERNDWTVGRAKEYVRTVARQIRQLMKDVLDLEEAVSVAIKNDQKAVIA